MESIVIKEVTKRSDIRAFIKFPNRLFKDVPTYIPPLMMVTSMFKTMQKNSIMNGLKTKIQS